MEEWRGRDLLDSVHDVCRLHWRKRGRPTFRGATPPEPVCEFARNSRIGLRGFNEYQSGLPEPSEQDPHHDEYRTFTTWLNRQSLEREGLHEWLDLIYRFRLPERRAGHETGRMDG